MNVTSAGSGEGSYYTWMDQFNTLGLGENVPINTGNQSEGLRSAPAPPSISKFQLRPDPLAR